MEIKGENNLELICFKVNNSILQVNGLIFQNNLNSKMILYYETYYSTLLIQNLNIRFCEKELLLIFYLKGI